MSRAPPPLLAPPSPQDSSLSFQLALESGAKLQARIFAVYDLPPTPHHAPAAGGKIPQEPAATQQEQEQGAGSSAAAPSGCDACTQWDW